MSWNARREGWTPQAEDAREDGDIDYARVIHSASFRRLQGKTQILNLGDSDFYRTRLTHSLEVAQIAGGLAKQLAKSFPEHPATAHLPDRSMIQAIGCTHDLGHPPFGHGGEVALNYCMRSHGGFEGNGQTLRILSRLESFSANAGANLSRRTLLGVLKYPVAYSQARNQALSPALISGPTTLQIIDGKASKPPKCYLDCERDIVDWIIQPLTESEREEFQACDPKNGKHHVPRHKSLDCSIMDAADDIAYGVHDLEDAIALSLIDKVTLANALQDKCPSFLDALKEKYPEESANDVFGHFVEGLFDGSGTRKRFISRLVHHFITAAVFVEHEVFADPLVRYRVKLQQQQNEFLRVLKDLVQDEVILNPSVQHLEFKGQTMVVSVFEALQADPKRLLPRDAYAKFAAANDDPRIICDHVAGMTDTYLLRTYERLFSPRMGSVFDKL
ncbi:anti-phage deoxyguanosine triphosphatase [Qipengyuania sp. DGS5-3]|uniref:anti-phage deoxyguanosine triphosphatase n=1 Tax=Qipengyuania sp. DGS5-3 TaxID=3349632 RepID=UPI0036D2F4AB